MTLKGNQVAGPRWNPPHWTLKTDKELKHYKAYWEHWVRLLLLLTEAHFIDQRTKRERTDPVIMSWCLIIRRKGLATGECDLLPPVDPLMGCMNPQKVRGNVSLWCVRTTLRTGSQTCAKAADGTKSHLLSRSLAMYSNFGVRTPLEVMTALREEKKRENVSSHVRAEQTESGAQRLRVNKQENRFCCARDSHLSSTSEESVFYSYTFLDYCSCDCSEL